MNTKKSRLGSDFKWGSNQVQNSKGLSTLQRNPRDDSDTKVQLSPEKTNFFPHLCAKPAPKTQAK